MKKYFNKRNILIFVRLGILISFAISVTQHIIASSYGKFVKIADMNVPRKDSHAVLLEDGRVLIWGGGGLSTIKNGKIFSKPDVPEIFDPKTGNFQLLNESSPSIVHYTTTILPNGKILIAGGASEKTLKSTILFNPETDKFEQGPDMIYPRSKHSATLLPNGNVLIVGGKDYDSKNTFIKNAEIYDYKENRFILGPEMVYPRVFHQTMGLSNGNVLVWNGVSYKKYSPLEVYDYKNNIFKPFPNNFLNDESSERTGIIELGDDRFLTLNVMSTASSIDRVALAVYKVQNDKIKKIQSLKTNVLGIGCAYPIKLDDNRLLLAGTCSLFMRQSIWASPTANSYIYDLKKNKLIKINNMTINRMRPSRLKIDEGKILILGGYTAEFFRTKKPTNKAEMFIYK